MYLIVIFKVTNYVTIALTVKDQNKYEYKSNLDWSKTTAILSPPATPLGLEVEIGKLFKCCGL